MGRSSRNRNYKISILVCSVCGNEMYIPRRAGRLRPKRHIKTMYCSKCDRKTDFIESGDTL